MNKHVLITGGAGLIGSTIADQLMRTDVASVRVLDDFSRGRSANLAGVMDDPRLEIIEADICDSDAVMRAMSGIDVVFHMAAIRITRCAEDPRLAVETLVNGTFNVVEAATAASVDKVVLASSASIYGLAEQFPTNEDHHPYANRTIYGAAKAFGESLLRSYNEMYGLRYVALRYFNVYGARMDIHGVYTEVLVRWMERIAAGQPPLILGDGRQTMDFVYVDDIARASILAATSVASDVVVNIASGVETSLLELAETLLQVMGSTLKPEFGPERKVNAVSRRLADTGRARQLLGFEAEVDLTEGLHRLVEWWRSEQAVASVEAD